MPIISGLGTFATHRFAQPIKTKDVIKKNWYQHNLKRNQRKHVKTQEDSKIFWPNSPVSSLKEKLFRCCSRLDEQLGWGEGSAGGRDIEVLLSGCPEQRTGEGGNHEIWCCPEGWLPNMIVLGKDCPTTWCCRE